MIERCNWKNSEDVICFKIMEKSIYMIVLKFDNFNVDIFVEILVDKLIEKV